MSEWIQNNQQEGNTSIKDSEYFEQLKKYKTLCYSGKNTPILLINQKWHQSLCCIILANLLYIISMIIFIANYHPEEEQQIPTTSFTKQSIPQVSSLVILPINVFIFVTFNISYFLTQFLNPGIKNLSRISVSKFKKYGKSFCQYCHYYRTDKMRHCHHCKVCVEGIDHHCGYFNKCIAGCQKWAFYAMMISTFLSFIGIMAMLSYVIF